MTREFLKGLGLDDDAVEKVMAEHGKDVEIHKTAAKKAEGRLKEFEGVDVNELKGEVERLTGELNDEKKNGKEAVEKLKLDYAVDGALSKAKAKNIKAARALLDVGSMKLSAEGGVEGLDEAIEQIKKDNGYLFEGNKPTFEIGGGSSGAAGDDDAAIRAVMGLPLKK